jgi:DNA-binding GntR family transcriptional regulator
MRQALSAATPAMPRQTTVDLVEAALRDAIVSGRFAPGSPLRQNDIAQDVGVSPVPVREALQRLVASGLAVAQTHRGVTVAPASERDFLDISELRQLLEPQALRKSAPNLTDEDFARAERAIDAAHRTTDALERARLHWSFHSAIYAKADRRRLLAQIDTLYMHINRYLLPAWSAAGLSENWCDSHHDIIRALKDKQVGVATKLVLQQIKDSEARVIRHLRATATVEESPAR